MGFVRFRLHRDDAETAPILAATRGHVVSTT